VGDPKTTLTTRKGSKCSVDTNVGPSVNSLNSIRVKVTRTIVSAKEGEE